MSAIEADLMDGALTISPQDTAAALAAAESALGAAPGSARQALTSLGFRLTELDAAFCVIGFRGVLDGPADAALDALAPFADGQALVFEDDNGVRWRYLNGRRAAHRANPCRVVARRQRPHRPCRAASWRR